MLALVCGVRRNGDRDQNSGRFWISVVVTMLASIVGLIFRLFVSTGITARSTDCWKVPARWKPGA